MRHGPTVMTALALVASAALASPTGALEWDDPAPLDATVVSGQSATNGQFPSTAQLVINFGRQAGGCTGTVIAPRWVLTAAHCITDERLVAQAAGSFAYVGDVGFLAGRQIPVTALFAHPEWTARGDTDVALVQLGADAGVPSMPLASTTDGLEQPGTAAVFAGWGTTSAVGDVDPAVLQWTSMSIVAPSRAYPAQLGYVLATPPSSATCFGDSGGPLMATAGGVLRVVGVLSGGAPCTPGSGIPDYYGSIPHALAWITEISGVGASGPPDGAPIAGCATTPPSSSQSGGYWMLERNGCVYGFGTAGSIGTYPLGGVAAVKLEPQPSGAGYWVLAATGQVVPFGAATALGDATSQAGWKTGERVGSMSSTPTGNGYWVFTTAGRVLAFGDARSFGDLTALTLNGPIVGSAATPTGNGYYLVASDGGIFAFGDARFAGSMGGRPLNAPVVGLVPDADNDGYWLVASDGGIFAFNAAFKGSMGGTRLNQPMIGAVRYGTGYLMVASDGGIFNFSEQAFFGSLGSTRLNNAIVSVAVR
jgi:ribosomal protein L24E